MGCMQSTLPPPPFEINESILGQSKESYDYLLYLGFEPLDIAYLYRAFDDIDGVSWKTQRYILEKMVRTL